MGLVHEVSHIVVLRVTFDDFITPFLTPLLIEEGY